MVAREDQHIGRLGSGGDGAPDLVLRGGRIYQGSAGASPRFAEALAVRDGRIVAVGSDAQVPPLAGPGTAVVDLDGATVVPGLIDSHLHLVRAGLTWSDEVTWYELATLDAAMGRLRDAAARTPAGTWLRVVGGWHPGQFTEGRGPTPDELTRAFPDHPVYVQLLYEDAVLNDAALRACGVGPGVADPPRGSFERDADGAPTGRIRGVGAFQHVLASIPDPARADAVAGTVDLMATLNRWGVTGAVDAGGLGMGPEAYEPLFDVWRAGRMTVRTRLYTCALTRGREVDEVNGWLRHGRPGFGDGWLRQVGMGEIVVFGCHDLEGLTPFAIDDASRTDLDAACRAIAGRGWPLHLHAILDTSIDTILDVWEAVDRDHPIGGLRWSLAHVDAISSRNLDRLAALDCGVAVQDRLVYRAADSARAWGAEVVVSAPPLRGVLDRGIPLGAGTDANRVASPNPWVSLWWLVTGRTVDGGPTRLSEQCLTRTEALDAYTAGSAWFSFEEHARGRLTPGAAADLAVLTDDYFSVADEALPTLASDLTIVDGRPVQAAGRYAGGPAG